MANLRNLYNPEAEAQTDIAAIPSGEYLAQITDSDMKPTKKNDGQYLELEYTVIEGDYKGRKVWARLNLDNPNHQTVEIANKQMASIREATGVARPDDSTQLHYKPHVIRVELIQAGVAQKNGYVPAKDSNEIRGWRSADGAVPAQAAPAAANQASAAAAAPWKRTA